MFKPAATSLFCPSKFKLCRPWTVVVVAANENRNLRGQKRLRAFLEDRSSANLLRTPISRKQSSSTSTTTTRPSAAHHGVPVNCQRAMAEMMGTPTTVASANDGGRASCKWCAHIAPPTLRQTRVELACQTPAKARFAPELFGHGGILPCVRSTIPTPALSRANRRRLATSTAAAYVDALLCKVAIPTFPPVAQLLPQVKASQSRGLVHLLSSRNPGRPRMLAGVLTLRVRARSWPPRSRRAAPTHALQDAGLELPDHPAMAAETSEPVRTRNV